MEGKSRTSRYIVPSLRKLWLTDNKKHLDDRAPGTTHYQNDPYAYESKKDKYRRQRDDAREELKDTIASNDKKTDVIRELVADLNKLTEDVEREKQLANRVQTEADNNENFLGRQVTDDEIRSQFDSLLASIKTWSAKFTGGDAENSLDAKNADDYVHVAPHYLPNDFPGLNDVVASHKKKRRLFMRGEACYSMSLLFRTLDADTRFHGEQTDSWLDNESAQSFGDIEKKLHAAGKFVVRIY